MKICMTNNMFPVGPKLAYGGERIIWYLADALAKRGHEIYFFSIAGSEPPPSVKDYIPIYRDESSPADEYYLAAVEYTQKNHIEYDIYACHYFGEKWSKATKCLAARYVEVVWNAWCHAKPWNDVTPKNIVSYSTLLQSDLAVRGVPSTMIHYGIPKDAYIPSFEHDDYAVWIAKMEGGKRPDLAIRLALAADMKIVVMGPPYNTNCFWQMVAPYLNDPRVFWVRGVDDYQKWKIMSRAKCFISSNGDDWREHFGITNIEALACGTPVIAFNKINQECAIWTDKIIMEGEHGFFLNYNNADDIDEILTKGLPLLKEIGKINRRKCRQQFERRFTSDLMAERYEWLYEYLLDHGNVDQVEVPF